MSEQRPTIVVLGFKTTYELNRESGKMDRAVDWVTYAPAHMAMYSQITERVDWMRPPENMKNDQRGIKMAFLRHRWSMIEKAYEAWKKGHEIPVDGTPLGVWPGINAGQVQAFHSVGIKTVEQVATMPESIMQRVPLPGVRDLRKQAEAFLANSDRAAASAKVSEQDAKIAALEEQLAAAMELLEEKAKPEKPAKAKAEKEAA